MALTIADVFDLPKLDSLVLRAGLAGVHSEVRWPYVAENESIAEWVMGGELVFVTGINHVRDEPNLLKLVEQGHQRHIAGLVVLTGQEYIKAIPQSVIQRADQLGLPLIEQPYQLKMVVVTQAVGVALVEAQMRGRSRLQVLEQLLEGDPVTMDTLCLRAQRLGIPIESPRQILVARLDGSDALIDRYGSAAAERQLQSSQAQVTRALAAWQARLDPVLPVLQQGDQWIVLLPEIHENPELRREYLAQWLAKHNQTLSPLRLCLGLGSPGKDVSDWSLGLYQARQALVAAQAFPDRLGLCSFDEMGALALLAGIRDRSILDRFVMENLGAVLKADKGPEPVLIPTLEAWFQVNGNLVLAAAQLGVHRNTMTSRLQRIEALLGSGLDDPNHRLSLAMALQIWRISPTRRIRSTA
ncbi:PucR family transcriptional regulator [Marinobacter sp. F3R11]|uniref:PucR family transcriptional regulator n=1 Tax=Marinobacter sp. F3R11 TaxID=2267231 RepID=UPI000DEAD7B9|nr:PucR family transcriptional regulator [Marinobacter sp. F3R11]RBW49968.1 PucR family transcriptional regulator [Marinobacter sp. F3R11]